jgi:hypothetical protein
VSYDLAVFTSDRPKLPAGPGDFEVDGPLAAEDEDAPPIVAAALLRVRWTVQISMPASRTRRDVEAVERFSRAVADNGRGVVYDPQADAIVWPRNPTKLRAVDAVEHGDERVELQWLFARRLTATDGDGRTRPAGSPARCDPRGGARAVRQLRADAGQARPRRRRRLRRAVGR